MVWLDHQNTTVNFRIFLSQTKQIICPSRHRADLPKLCVSRIAWDGPTVWRITPDRWPGLSHTPQPDVSSAVGFSDILLITVSSAQTCQPRSATVTEIFHLAQGVKWNKKPTMLSLLLFISLRIWMNLPHITARRWHLWRTPACWESCLSSLDSSGPKMKKTFRILQNKMIKHLLWRDKLCSRLAQCSARFSPCLPARRTLWLRAPRSAQRSYGQIIWHLDLIVARCRVRGPVKLTLCVI